MKRNGHSPEGQDLEAQAAEALDKARKMKPGPERDKAIKKAGQSRDVAGVAGYLTSRELEPPK